MAVEADLVAYLDPLIAEAGGTSLFEGPPSETEANAIFIAHYDSEKSDDFTMGPSLDPPGSELESVQVTVRNTVRATAVSRANAIHALLDNAQNLSIGGRTYFRIESDGPPAGLGQDELGRWIFVASYHVRKHRG